MAEKLYPYALTSLAAVKNRLDIKSNDWDSLLTRYINQKTDFIERECGKSGLEAYPNDGHFIQKKYLNEVYSVRGANQIYLPLRNAPLTYLIVTGNLTQGSANVTVAPYAGIQIGMPLIGIQGLFPQGTTVATVGSNGALTMSQPASVSQTGAVFEISGLISFQWRAGTPSSPNWTDFITDQFEVLEQGHSAILRVYGVMPRLYSNMLRATYVAGFPFNFQNAGDGSTHQLPADLTELCEDLVERAYRRRGLAGKSSESMNGATVSFRDKLDAHDLEIIANYKRLMVTV